MVIKQKQSYDCLRISDQEATRPKTYPDQQIDTQVWSIVLMKTQYPGATIVARGPRYERWKDGSFNGLENVSMTVGTPGR